MAKITSNLYKTFLYKTIKELLEPKVMLVNNDDFKFENFKEICDDLYAVFNIAMPIQILTIFKIQYYLKIMRMKGMVWFHFI